jgi:hypothetical protein
MKTIDWNKVKFRASSWGALLAEPKLKTDKDAGKLSDTCQGELIKIYNLYKYGRKKDITTKQMTKGIQCEDDSIQLFSMVEGELFVKNEHRLENEHFTGHPDIYTGEDITNATQLFDIKTSWEIDSFTPKLVESANKAYIAQLNVYFDLCNCQSGGIVYCLVSAPFGLIEEEKKRLLYKMDVISEESPEFKEAAAEIDHLMTFEDIDYRERVIKIPVQRDEELIQKMKDKVPRLREWLFDFEKLHMKQYPKENFGE